MPYTAPTKDTFTGLFPAFSAVSDAQYDFWSAQAVLVTEPIEACLGDRMDLATMLATAHYLTEQGIGTGAESQMAAEGMGGFKSIKSGSLSLDRGDSSGSSSSETWGTSSYGTRLYPMLKACFGGPRVTGTGTILGSGCPSLLSPYGG
jgi:hypothetical protein